MDTETPKTLASAADLSKKVHASLDELIKLATKLQADLLSVATSLSDVHRTTVATGSLPVQEPLVAPVPPGPHPVPHPEPQPPPPHHAKEEKHENKKH